MASATPCRNCSRSARNLTPALERCLPTTSLLSMCTSPTGRSGKQVGTGRVNPAALLQRSNAAPAGPPHSRRRRIPMRIVLVLILLIAANTGSLRAEWMERAVLHPDGSDPADVELFVAKPEASGSWPVILFVH